jgi:hypothetical protein
MKSDKSSHGIGPGGRWLIFSGVPIGILAILMVLTSRDGGNMRGVSEKYLPYVIVLLFTVVFVVCRELYHRFPKHLIIPFGCVGWMITVVLLCWFFWFGPGALKF